MTLSFSFGLWLSTCCPERFRVAGLLQLIQYGVAVSVQNTPDKASEQLGPYWQVASSVSPATQATPKEHHSLITSLMLRTADVLLAIIPPVIHIFSMQGRGSPTHRTVTFSIMVRLSTYILGLVVITPHRHPLVLPSVVALIAGMIFCWSHDRLFLAFCLMLLQPIILSVLEHAGLPSK